LPEITNNKPKIVLFQDNTVIFVTNAKNLAFTNVINTVYNYMNDWFNANLSLNTDKFYLYVAGTIICCIMYCSQTFLEHFLIK